MTREELVNSREYKIAGAALNDISNIDEEYADNEDYIGGYVDGFENGAEWADRNPQNLWHDAQGDDLPPIDKEVIVLRNNGQIAFGHRPNPDGEIWKHPDGTLEHVDDTLEVKETDDAYKQGYNDAIDKACDAYCRLCDTKECGDTSECEWVEKFRKRLMRQQ